MGTLKTIMSRRSIYQFKESPISNRAIKRILKAAMNAPSAGDGRPWHFVVIKNREKLNAIAEKVDEGNATFKEAQAAILICGDESKEGFLGFYPQNCACAGQNIYLASHDLGLGTVWIALWSVQPRINGIKEVISIPENIIPFAIFPLGVPKQHPGEDYRYDETLIHRGSW